MHPLSLAEYLQSAASAIAAGRLIQIGFSRGQRALLVFLAFIAADLAILASLDPASHSYFNVFLSGTVLSWIVGIAAVREMFALTFANYPGIGSAGRWVLYIATCIAVAVSVLLTGAFSRQIGRVNPWLYYIQFFDRSIVFTLAVVIAAILMFLSRYPLHLSRNTYVSTSFFSAVFLSEAAVMAIDSFSRNLYSNWVDVTQVIFAASCFLGWAFLLRPEHAASQPRRVLFDSPEEHQLLQQLDSLNRLLSRTGRR